MARSQKLELTWFNKDKALIPTETGKYGYTWVDPSDPRYCETHTLVVDEVVRGVQSEKEEGTTYSERADFTPTDDNLLILGESGDVLEALVRVPELRDKYVGKVKCVYIDPPFNTAQTFANYEDNLEHSVWLTMMRDRLLHLRDLLSDDGSIWVHLDDVENHRMRMVLDEVFGAGNFVAEMTWEKTYSPRNESKGIPSVTDVILVYRKGSFVPNSLPRTAEMNARYSNPDNDVKGAWKSDNTTAPGGATHQGMVYAIQHPFTGEMMYPSRGRHWSRGTETMFGVMNEYAPYKWEDIHDEDVRSDRCNVPVEEVRRGVPALILDTPLEDARNSAKRRIAVGNWPYFVAKVNGSFQRKGWLSEKQGIPPRTLMRWEEVGHTDGALREMKTLFPEKTPFATPKPERLLERIIHIATNPGDIVLDVFGGSGTTAAVAHKMGRRWVTCELVEDTFNRFTRPRLEKVVNNQDPGGITLTKGERVDATENGLPEGVKAEDAQKFTSLLNKLIADNPELKKSAQVKELKALSKTTKTKDTVNWRGGGGFTVAQLSPTCFDYVPEIGLTTLTEHATGETLVNSVAANLGFHLTPDDLVFDGRRGKQRLAVIEGTLTRAKVDELNTHRADGESVLFAALMLEEGVRDYVRSLKNGSRVVAVPSDVFPTVAGGTN